MDNSLYYQETCTVQDIQNHDQQLVEMLKIFQSSLQQQYQSLLEYQNFLVVSGNLTEQIQQTIQNKLVYYRNFYSSLENLINDFGKINYEANLNLLHYQEEIMKNKIQQTVSTYFT